MYAVHYLKNSDERLPSFRNTRILINSNPPRYLIQAQPLLKDLIGADASTLGAHHFLDNRSATADGQDMVTFTLFRWGCWQVGPPEQHRSGQLHSCLQCPNIRICPVWLHERSWRLSMGYNCCAFQEDVGKVIRHLAVLTERLKKIRRKN